jgi:uncharacterized protein (DUF2147 family)
MTFRFMSARFTFAFHAVALALLAASMMLCAGGSAIAQESASPAGVWLTEKGDARVQISHCGEAICGKVVWLREPINPATGQPQVDDKNPNPELRERPVIGLQLFSGMRPAGISRWSGRIYNADDGKFYVSNLAMTGPTTLQVEGCVGALCGGETWRKVGAR